MFKPHPRNRVLFVEDDAYLLTAYVNKVQARTCIPRHGELPKNEPMHFQAQLFHFKLKLSNLSKPPPLLLVLGQRGHQNSSDSGGNPQFLGLLEAYTLQLCHTNKLPISLGYGAITLLSGLFFGCIFITLPLHLSLGSIFMLP